MQLSTMHQRAADCVCSALCTAVTCWCASWPPSVCSSNAVPFRRMLTTLCAILSRACGHHSDARVEWGLHIPPCMCWHTIVVLECDHQLLSACYNAELVRAAESDDCPMSISLGAVCTISVTCSITGGILRASLASLLINAFAAVPMCLHACGQFFKMKSCSCSTQHTADCKSSSCVRVTQCAGVKPVDLWCPRLPTTSALTF